MLQHIRLTHPELDFWVDVRLREFDGRWLAAADLAEEPDVRLGHDPRGALARGIDGGPKLADELFVTGSLR